MRPRSLFKIKGPRALFLSMEYIDGKGMPAKDGLARRCLLYEPWRARLIECELALPRGAMVCFLKS